MTCVGLALQAVVAWGLFGTCAGLRRELRHAEPRGSSAGAPPGAPTVSFSGLMHSLPQEERLRRARPVAWVHVPKTSSTFMNAVIHLPCVCPGLQANVMLCSDRNPDCSCARFSENTGQNYSSESDFVPRVCAGGTARFCNHGGFSTQYLHSMRGHGFIMMREAHQRIMSGYYNPGDHHGWRIEWGEPASIREYAEWVQGTAVKMIASDRDHFQGGAPYLNETHLAIQRLREGFAFVGIHEEYALSICLLHKMFGNSCNHKEFPRFHQTVNGRRFFKKSVKGSNTTYDTSALMGFRDVHDSMLYEAALAIFRENVKLYVGSPAECARCFRQAGLQSSELEEVGRLMGKDRISWKMRPNGWMPATTNGSRAEGGPARRGKARRSRTVCP